MEKRVIKFNLVGSIFILLLIIAGVVGIVIGVNKFKNNKESDLAIGNNQNQSQIDENKEYKELVKIGEEEKEITMKICKGSFDYQMKYDVNSFFVNKQEEVDKFESLTSESIYINVKKDSEEFEDKVNDFILEDNRSEGWNDYKINQTEINGKNAYSEIMTNDSETIIYYYIKAEKGCYIIEIHCGNSFVDNTIPIIEKMVQSFKGL